MSSSTSSSRLSLTSSTTSASITSTSSRTSSTSKSEETKTTSADEEAETSSDEDDEDDEDDKSTDSRKSTSTQSSSRDSSSTTAGSSSKRPSLSTATSSSSSASSSSDSDSKTNSQSSTRSGPARLNTTTTSSPMPALSTLVTRTTSSYTVTFTPTVPTSSDPFIQRETALNGTVFIGVGSVLVGGLLLYYLHRLYNYYTSKKNTDTGNLMEQLNTNYIFNKGKFNSGDSDDDISTVFGNHSSLSLNKLANDANAKDNKSIYSANLFNSRSSLIDMNELVSQQGRSYKNAINKIGTTRASCYISPVGQLVQPYGNGDFELPIDYDSNASSYSSMQPGNISRQSNTPNLSSNGSSVKDAPKKKRRPPSVLLDDLINQA